MHRLRVAASIALAVGLAACSGGGAKTIPTTPSRAPASAHVTFTMVWNAATASSARRGPRYVPATARSVSVAVNNGTSQYLNAPATTLAIDAPVGTDTFVFQTYDEQNGQGNVLSHAAVTQTIVDGAANVVAASLNGVVASVAIALAAPATNAGAVATMAVLVSAKDADGNTIVGASDYSIPISLSISDPTNSGTLSLSTLSIPNPATSATLHYSGGTLTSATIVASAPGVAAVSTAITPTPTFYAYQLSGGPFGVVAGADGNMWFTEDFGGKIGRVTLAGVVTEFPLSNVNANPEPITAGTDGRLWFTEQTANKIGAITTSGAITEYPGASGCAPEAITSRSDGTIWYGCDGGTVNVLMVGGSAVGSATVGSLPFALVAGPDGNMYVANYGGSSISYLSDPGATVNTISTGSGSNPAGITVGPDGAIWYTDRGLSKIGRISTSSHSVTATYPTLTANASPNGIIVGADGALWFTELTNGKIGRITTSGVVTEYASPLVSNTASDTFTIATARDGSLWIAPLSSNLIEKFVY